MEYHKIQTLFKRDAQTKKIIEGEFTCPEFEFLRNNRWVFTEKVDGTNIRINWNGEIVTYGGRTDNAQIPANLFNRLQELFGGEEKKTLFIEKFGDKNAPEYSEVTLFGEGYGAKIQKGGGLYKPHADFVLFDVQIGGWWLQREDVKNVASFFGIDVVPILHVGTIDEMIEAVKAGITSTWGDFQAEGIVARPETELRMRSGQRVITKIKHRDFK